MSLTRFLLRYDAIPEITFYGHSFIAGVQGQLVERMDAKHEGVITAEFDLNGLRCFLA